LDFRVWVLGFRVEGLGFRVWGLGFRVEDGLGFIYGKNATSTHLQRVPMWIHI
jgi:hypothetical protein